MVRCRKPDHHRTIRFATLNYYGLPVLIKGANGYQVTGQAQLNSGFGTYPNASDISSNRDQLYAQTDYKITPYLTALGSFLYEDERGSNNYPTYDIARLRNEATTNTLPSSPASLKTASTISSAAAFRRTTYTASKERPEPESPTIYAVQARAPSREPSSTFNFSKGVQEPSLSDQFGSLYDTLLGQPGGEAAIEQAHISQIGAQQSRTYDGGVEQSMLNEKMLLRATYFHNQFGNQIEYVDSYLIPQLLPNLTPAEQQALVAALENTYGGM